MSLESGGAHPLAREADLQPDTDLPVNFLDVWADVIWNQIVLVLVDLCTEDRESDVRRYLSRLLEAGPHDVGEAHGSHGTPTAHTHNISKVHRAPNGTYEGAFTVPSPDLVLFLKRDTPSIERCRVTSPRPRDSHRASTDDDNALPSPRVMRTLAHPAFHPKYRVHTAYVQTDRHTKHQHQGEVPEAHPQEERHRAPCARAPPVSQRAGGHGRRVHVSPAPTRRAREVEESRDDDQPPGALRACHQT